MRALKKGALNLEDISISDFDLITKDGSVEITKKDLKDGSQLRRKDGKVFIITRGKLYPLITRVK